MKTAQDYIKKAVAMKKSGDSKYYGYLPLLTLKQLEEVNDGTRMICGLNGEVKIKGEEYIDSDTRGGVTAWAIDID